MLSADFAFAAGGLVLDGFDGATSELTITQAGDNYQFTIDAGEWRGVPIAGVSVNDQTLSVRTETLNALAEGILITATADQDLALTFGETDFDGFSGTIVIDGATSVGQTPEAAASTTITAPFAVTSSTSGTVLTGLNVGNSFSATAAGPLTDEPGVTINITGDATFISREAVDALGDINSDGVIDTEDVNEVIANFGAANPGDVDVNGDLVVNAADFVVLRDLFGAAGDGGIFLGDDPTDEITIGGLATFEAQSEDGASRFDINVGVDSNGDASGATIEFGSVSLFGGDAVVNETSGTAIDDSDLLSLDLTSAGAIEDTGNSDVEVAGLASFTAGPGEDIILDDIFNFGSLTFNGNEVTIVEQSGLMLVGDSNAATLNLDVAGAITDTGTTSVTITGLAEFSSTTGDLIALDDGTYAFGSITVNGGDVTLVEPDGTEFAGISFVNSLDVDSGGDLTDATDAQITVVGNASFDASPDDNLATDDENDILLDSPNLNFGTLELRGDQVTINEASGSVLAGSSLANTLGLTAVGTITDQPDALLDVTGLATFTTTIDDADSDADLEDITLNSAMLTFGSLSLIGGAIAIDEADATSLDDITAESLLISSQGEITNIPGALIAVENNANFVAVDNVPELNNITLAAGDDGAINFGTLTFTGADVQIEESSSTELTGTSSAVTLALTATGDLTDDDSGLVSLNVVGNASFTANDDDADTVPEDILLDSTQLSFGNLTFVGSSVTIVEENATSLANSSTADTLQLTSGGSIVNTPFAGGVIVTGNANFTAATGEEVNLTNILPDLVDFGTLTFSGGDVTIEETNGSVFSGTSLANTLNLTANTGDITDDATAVVLIIANASLTAGNGNITLDDEFRFGTLTFNATVVDLLESDGTTLAGNSNANELMLTSLGSITDTADATLFVANGAGTATFTANGSIVLADGDTIDNQLAVINATFIAGQGAAPGDDIFIGVTANGEPAAGLVLLNIFSAQAPGDVAVVDDGNVGDDGNIRDGENIGDDENIGDLVPPESIVITDEAFSSLAIEELAEDQFDALSEDALALGA